MLAKDAPELEVPGERPVAYADGFWDHAGPFTVLEATVVWEVAPATGDAFIYPALFFQFSDWKAGGYFGTQIYGAGRGAHFSIWDHEGEFESSIPMTPTCERFAHEGNGTMCHIEYPWVEGREYSFRMTVGSSSAAGEVWHTTITDVETAETQVIGRILVKSNGQRDGFGLVAPWGEFFLEYFGGPSTCHGHEYSRVTWSGPFADGLLPDRVVALYNSCMGSNVTSSGPGTVTLEGGTLVVRTTPAGTALWR